MNSERNSSNEIKLTWTSSDEQQQSQSNSFDDLALMLEVVV